MSRSPHLDPEWLRQKYEVEKLSTYDIAKIVGRDPKRIHDKLRDFGIRTRPRGHNLHGVDNSWAQPGYESHWIGRKHSDESRAKIAAAASHPKPWLRGEANGMHGVTGVDNPNYRGGNSPERQRIYASGEWKELVRQVYKRDGYCCQRCGATKSTPRSLHAHHVMPWSVEELRFDPDNLATLCRTCHQWVHSRANIDGEWIHTRPNRSNSEAT